MIHSLLILCGICYGATPQTAPSSAPVTVGAWADRVERLAADVPDPQAKAEAMARVAAARAVQRDRAGFNHALTEAVRQAEQIKSPVARAMTFTVIAEACARAGATPGFRQNLAQARKAAEAADERGRAVALRRMVWDEARWGDVEQAQALTDEVKEPRARAEVLQDLADATAAAGRREAYARAVLQARAAADTARDDFTRSALRARLVRVQLAATDQTGAAQSASGITDATWRVTAYSDIAAAASGPAAKPYFEQAMSSANAIPAGDYRRVEAYLQVSAAQRQSGDLAAAAASLTAARKAAEQLVGSEGRGDAESVRELCAVARACAAADRHEDYEAAVQRAVDVTERLGDPRDKAEAWMRIAAARAAEGDAAGARAAIDRAKALSTDPPPASLYEPVIAELARAGKADDARQMAAAIADERASGRAFGAVAQAQVAAGDLPGAEQTVAQSPSSARESLCFQLGAAAAEAGKLDQLGPWLDGLPSAADRLAGTLGALDVLLSARPTTRPTTAPAL